MHGQGHAEGSKMDPRGHFKAGNNRLKLTCFPADQSRFPTFNFCSIFVFTYPSSTAFLYMEKAKIACKIELEKQLSEQW
jgi:hypothetical protein